MRILRFFLLLASVVGAVYIFHALHAGTVPSDERSIAWLFGLGLVLNIFFLYFAARSLLELRGSVTFFAFGTMLKCVSSENVPASRPDWIERSTAIVAGISARVPNGEQYALG